MHAFDRAGADVQKLACEAVGDLGEDFELKDGAKRKIVVARSGLRNNNSSGHRTSTHASYS
jgi:hypothetical protein